jgi:two-component system chemotaxis response regulator CheY
LEAADGIEGIDRLGEAEVSLVICDVNMPRMGGLDMVEKVKSTPALANVPFLMLTSEGQPALIHRAKKAGAKGWIVKPFNADLLAAAVHSVLARNSGTSTEPTS